MESSKFRVPGFKCEEGNEKMKFIYFDKIDSTQKHLLKNFQKYELPVCIWSEFQTEGIGSRGNKWIGKRGNLFFSFAYKVDEFKGIPLQSLSIYFGWIFKKTLNSFGSEVVLKWPNDIYLIKEKPLKVGGVITNIKRDILICGIGLNTKYSPSLIFGSLDIEIKNDKILKEFFKRLESKINFFQVIKEYKIEFEKTKSLFKIDGDLGLDGAILKNNKRVYSKR